jgi:hypothetical protein
MAVETLGEAYAAGWRVLARCAGRGRIGGPKSSRAIMARVAGTKNKRTLLRESQEAMRVERDPNKIADMLYIMEYSATFYFTRAVAGASGKQKGKARRTAAQVDEDFDRATRIAGMAAPYRRARLSAIKVAGDPSNPMQFKDDATAEELRAEIVRRLNILQKAGILELKPVAAAEVQ